MKLLLDECVARDFKRDLTGHDVVTVVEAGYQGLKNGELLRAASGAYDRSSQSIAICPFSKTFSLFNSES